jgi:hypothetical protein
VTALLLRLRSELRARWRSWLVLALLVGLAGGAAIAAAAGARRTQTAYPRFVKAQKAADLFLGGAPENIDIEQAYTRIQGFPQVSEWARIDLVSPEVRLPSGALLRLPEIFPAVNPDGRAGFRFNRFKLLSGRLFNPRSSDEALVDFTSAERLRVNVGSVVGVRVAEGDEPAAFAPVRIVGIVASPGQFPAVGVFALSNIYLTPAFPRAHGIEPSPEDTALLIRLRNGPRDIPAFLREMDRAGLGEIDVPATEPVQTEAVQKSIRFESQALWILAALVAISALAILGQSLARQTSLESSDHPVLRALGFSRRQLFALGVLRAASIAGAGAIVAAGVAVLMSPLTPIGLARIAEPDIGFYVDGVILAAGAVVTIVLLVLSSAAPAWTAARSLAGPDAPDASWGAARRASRFRTLSLSPAASTGVRLALDPGRGPTAVPVRSAIVGGALGIAALIAALLFGSSLTHLLSTPTLSGSSWDVFLVLGEEEQERAISLIRAHPDVAGYSFPGGFVNLRLGGESVFGFVVDGKGGVGPVIAEGRAPSSPNEIALGNATMRSLNTRIGRSIEVFLDEEGGRSAQMLVVGRAIIPPAPFAQSEQGAGAALTWDSYQLFQSQFDQRELPVLIRFREGADRDLAFSQLLGELSGDHFYFSARRSGQWESLGRMTIVPVLLSWLLAAVAAATLVHTLVSSVRRRRRDLAILKTLGFLGKQIRAAVAWQATVLVIASVALGLPLGIAAGRWGWRAFADLVAVLPVPVIPLIALALLLPSGIVLANLTAVVPGAIAARTQPAQVLRTE